MEIMKKIFLLTVTSLAFCIISRSNAAMPYTGPRSFEESRVTPMISRDIRAAVQDKFIKDLRQTEIKLKKLLASINESATRVLVVGITGSGKSTLVNSLAGIKLFVSQDKGENFILIPDPDNPRSLTVGEGFNSVTKTPEVLYDQARNIVYFDCPGFGDTEGPEQEIINAFAIDLLFSDIAPTSILLTIHHSDTGPNGRGKQIASTIDRLQRLLDQSQLKDCLTGVITGIESRQTAYKQITLVTDEFPLLCPLLYSLQNPQRTFSFPKPKEDSEIGQEYNIFIQKDEIIKSITTNSVSRIKHNISLNDDSINALIAILGNFGNMIDFPNRFGEALRTQLRTQLYASEDNIEKIEKLKEWLRRIKQFIKADIKNIDEFIRVAQKESLPPEFSKFFDEINEFQSIAHFTSKFTSRLPKHQKELIDKSCGQNLGDCFSTILKNVASEFDTRIQLLEGKITQEQAKLRVNELQRSIESSDKQRQALSDELEKLKEKANQDWWTRFTKGFKRITVGFKNICIGVREIAGTEGTFIHEVVFGGKKEEGEKEE